MIPPFTDEELDRDYLVATMPEAFYVEVQGHLNFGVMYIEREPLAMMVVPATDDLPAFQSIAEKYGVEDLVELRTVRYSEAELRALQDEIGSDWAYWRSEGVEFSRGRG